MWGDEYPYLYRLFRASNENHSDNYFSLMGEPSMSSPARESYRRWDEAVGSLDPAALSSLIAKASRYVIQRHPDRGWHQLFYHLCEAFGYIYLKQIGYERIVFLPQEDILTPDLYATKGASAALLEVKTIAASDNDVTRFKLHEARTAVYGLPTTFKQKVRRTLATAVDQLDSYSRGTVNRRICMLRIRLDLDVDLPAQNHIELQSFIRSLSTPAIEVVYEEYP
jgi:hypothetical protein